MSLKTLLSVAALSLGLMTHAASHDVLNFVNPLIGTVNGGQS